jgi:hypothetical protein
MEMKTLRWTSVARLALAIAAGGATAAHAFTQDIGGGWYGHERIMIEAAKMKLAGTQAAGGGPVPVSWPRDKYGAPGLNAYSAVLGERFTDLGGWNVDHTDKIDPVMQNSEIAQAWHFLRRKCDVGGAGLRAAYDRAMEWLKRVFGLAAGVPPGQRMDVIDSGVDYSSSSVDKRYFLFGIVAHGVQDSFSTEHTIRSPDFMRILDIKSYVGTKYAWPHRHDKPLGPGHGDFIYMVSGGGVLKTSAWTAALATAALFRAFESATAANYAERWDNFAGDWMRLDSSTTALGEQFKDPGCQPDRAIEENRLDVMESVGREDPEWLEFPRFSCQKDATDPQHCIDR